MPWLIAMLPASGFAFTREDHIFADFLIRELRYYDTAMRWLDQERRKTSDKKALAEIDSYRILCYQGQKGMEAEAARALEDFKKNYPDHVWSAGGDLESLVGEVARVVDLLEKALRQADEKKAAELTAEALRIFDANVDRPLEASIKGFEDQISAAKKAEQKKGKEKAPSGPKKPDEKLSNLLLSRDKAELARIKIHLSVARKLPASHPRRTEILEKGRGLARSFVDERFEFFVMQYDAQLQVGIYSYEMGKHAEAMQDLKILFDAEPPVAPPFSEDMVAVFKDFRLQSMLFAARALTASKQADQAAEVIRKHVLTATPGQFDLSKAEDDPRLKQLAVLVRLEHGIALAASGKGRQGLDVIQGVIAKYSKLGQAGEAFVTDARKALGRIAGLGGVTLRAEDYYQAAVGLKSELRIEESLEMFKTALASLNPRNAKETGELAPLCLNEIGELYFFFLKSPLEAALAYEELSRHHFPKEGELATRVARNFLASIRRAIDATPGAATHAGLNKVKEAAEARSRGLDEGFDVYLSMMADAARLEEQGKFREARQKYLEVPKTAKGKKVPFYWRAQASRWKCVVAEYEAAKGEEKERLEPDLAKASGELEKIIPLALADQDLTGAALASLTLGQIHFQAQKYSEAAKALAHFRKDLADEPLYRCFGLGYLVLAETRVDDCAQAESDFEILHAGDCAKEALVAPVALDLSDCFERAGDAAKAGRYMLVYAEHPASKDDLEKFETVLVVVNRLIRGGHEKEARAIIKRFVEKTKQDPKLVDRDELARRIIIWDVRIAAYAKKWDEVIEKLEAYKTKYPPAGDHPEDPYIQRDLGEAYLGRVQESGGRDAERRAEDLAEAAQAYNNACGLLNNIRKFDPTVEKTFWGCLLRFVEIQMQIGNAASYRAVVNLVTTSEKTGGDMGGLKEEFLKLANEARAKLGSPAASAGGSSEPRPAATPKSKARSKPKAKPKPKASATP